ncbi:OV-16 antigen isoform X2 [Bemisia tabaci]|uniref:OV-16 antigen isoform X2 n=1 Tax=Bemisia tabaci TaxID=7038 RepID=UPI003B282E3B
MKVLGFYASFVYWTGIYSLAASSDVLNPIPEFEQSWLLKERIVPDLVSVIPRHSLIVTYEKAIVHFGNLMDKFDILDAPIHVAWPSKNNTFYTLIATGSDPPKKLATVTPEYLHWVLGNIPGKEWGEGENIKKYQGLLTGFHFVKTKQMKSLGTSQQRIFQKLMILGIRLLSITAFSILM